MQFTVTTREGESVSVDGAEGASFMEAIRNHGIDEMLALCGGQLSCATCHVYFEERCLDALPEMSHFENDLLDSSDHRKPASRLACQVTCKSSLAGCLVTIAPED
jgi:2Fe-2S ferredoxin